MSKSFNARANHPRHRTISLLQSAILRRPIKRKWRDCGNGDPYARYSPECDRPSGASGDAGGVLDVGWSPVHCDEAGGRFHALEPVPDRREGREVEVAAVGEVG